MEQVACVLTLGLFLFSVSLSQAGVLYDEDFSVVDDWNVVFNQQGGSATITTDGNIGSLNVAEPNNLVAYGPDVTSANFVSFASASAAAFYLEYTVDSVTGSTSYSIEIDQYNSSEVFLSTVFGVISQTAAIGSFQSQRFDAFTWDVSTAFILPKIQMFTGTGSQTIGFDTLQILSVPEPETLYFFIIGCLGGVMVRRRVVA